MHEKQTVMFRTVNGNVTINEALRKPEQSKDIIKQIRFEPQDADELAKLCFDKNINFSEFTRMATDLLKVYFDQQHILLKHSEKLIPVIEMIPKDL